MPPSIVRNEPLIAHRFVCQVRLRQPPGGRHFVYCDVTYVVCEWQHEESCVRPGS